MPVHNAMPFLPQAIESILAQDCPDFEFVIGDDASSDGSRACLADYARRDARIRVVHGRERLGSVGSSDWVAREARAPLVARMDADDVAVPTRLGRAASRTARAWRDGRAGRTIAANGLYRWEPGQAAVPVDAGD